MFRKLILICLGVLVPSLVAFSLAQSEPRADFTYVNPSGIHTLDPAAMSWTQDFRVALNIWEGLTTWDPQTVAPIEGVAYFPPTISDDRLTYTFTIRDDARWSNGDVVTAQDFVRGWRRAMEPGTATDYAFLFTDYIAGAKAYVHWRQESISRLKLARSTHTQSKYDAAFDEMAGELDPRFASVGIEANDQTLIVALVRPCPYFLDLAGFPTLLPIHESIELLRERHRGAPFNQQGLVVYDPQWTKPDYHRNGYPGLITNGPYKLEDWKFKRRARMTANSLYREAANIACRTVDMLEFDNISASIMAYESGDVDFLTDLSVPYDHELVRLARSGRRPDFKQCEVLATYFFNFNCVSEGTDGKPNPFRDARIRRAFSLATDKQAIVDNVLRRGDRAARSFVPPGTIAGYEPPQGLRRDVNEARRLLAESGHANGDGLPPIELLYSPSDERICQAIARTWENDLNVRVELRSKESKTFANDKQEHRFMIARGNWYADYNDPTTFLDTLVTGNGNNDSGYANAEYDKLLDHANHVGSTVERAELLRQAERIVVEEDCPILPILHRVETIAMKPYVRGLFPNSRLWFPFRYVHIER